MEPHADHEAQLVQHLLSPTANSICVCGNIRIGSSQIPSSFYHDRYSEVLGPTPVDLSSWLLTSSMVSSGSEPSQDRLHPTCLACDANALSRKAVSLATHTVSSKISKWLLHSIYLLTAVPFGELRGKRTNCSNFTNRYSRFAIRQSRYCGSSMKEAIRSLICARRIRIHQ